MGASNVRGDRQALHRTMKAIMSDAQRTNAQGQLPGLDRSVLAGSYTNPHGLPDRIAELVHEIAPRRRLTEMVLDSNVVADIREFLDEFSNSALLHANSLEPRHTVLLVGPPGNGKTSLAEAVAAELSLPLLSVRYDAIIDSFLGETSNRLRRLIDYAALNPCVLFFDEFDAVGKERSDAQETGEIKRVVSSLLMQMDRLPSHAIIICATNHPELLDRAVWRRFELKLEIGRPGPNELISWFTKFEKTLGAGPTGINAQEFARCMAGENMSEVEAFTLNVRRKIVLSKGKLSIPDALRQVLDRHKNRLNPQQRDIRDDEQQLSNRAPPKRSAKRKADQVKNDAALPSKDSLSKAN